MERAGNGVAASVFQRGSVLSAVISSCHLPVVLFSEVVASGKDLGRKERNSHALATLNLGLVNVTRPLSGCVEDKQCKLQSAACWWRGKVCAPPSETTVCQEDLAGVADALERVFNRAFEGSVVETDGSVVLISSLELQSRSLAATGESEASPSCPTPEATRRRLPLNAERIVVDVEVGKTVANDRSLNAIVRRSAGELGVKRRLNLVSRIALRKLRLENGKGRSVPAKRATVDAEDIWSDEAEQLIAKYGSSLHFEWDRVEHRLLSFEEEISLTRLLKPAMRLAKIRVKLQEQIDQDPSDEAWANAANVSLPVLRRQLLVSQAARNRVIKRNLRLVLFQAHKYHNANSSLSFFDFCQEGVSGLIEAVDRFDPEKGHRFSTYAMYWVRNSMLRAQTRSGGVLRSPYNVAMHRFNIKKVRLDLLVELERAPTHKEVMQRLGLKEDRYRDILRSCPRAGSLQAPHALTGKEIGEYIAADNQDIERRVLESSCEAVLRLGMEDALASLKPKERLVLRQRFGLDGKGRRTLAQIGRNLSISQEMVRRYEAGGLLRLKDPTCLDYLRTYLL